MQESFVERLGGVVDGVHAEAVDAHGLDPVAVDLLETPEDRGVVEVDVVEVAHGVGQGLLAAVEVRDVGREVVDGCGKRYYSGL